MTTSLSRQSDLTPAQLANYFNAKLAAEWGPHTLKRALEEQPDGILVLDVRDRDGFKEEHIPGSINIPLDELDSRWQELPRNREVVTYCWNITCSLCTRAALFLANKGYHVRELVGGIAEWQAAGFPTQRKR